MESKNRKNNISIIPVFENLNQALKKKTEFNIFKRGNKILRLLQKYIKNISVKKHRTI